MFDGSFLAGCTTKPDMFIWAGANHCYVKSCKQEESLLVKENLLKKITVSFVVEISLKCQNLV